MIYIFLLNGFYTLSGSVSFNRSIKFILTMCIIVGIVKIVVGLRLKVYPDLLLIGISFILVLVFYSHNSDTRLAVAILTMICFLYDDIQEVITYFFYSKLFFYIIVLLTGGYGHINGIALHGGIILLLYICKLDKGLKWINILIVLIGFLGIVLYTDSGSAKIAMVSTIILVVLVKLKKLKWLYKSKIITFSYPIAMFINFYCAKSISLGGKMPFIGNILPERINSCFFELVVFLDKATTSRLTLASYSLNNFGISLWGNNVDYSILNLGYGGYFNLDSGFMWLLQGWGIFMTVIFCIMTVYMMIYFIRNEKYNYVVAGIVIALWGINEDMILSVGTNFLLVFMLKSMSDYLNKNKKFKRSTIKRIA